jgi:hypothetical protein
MVTPNKGLLLPTFQTKKTASKIHPDNEGSRSPKNLQHSQLLPSEHSKVGSTSKRIFTFKYWKQEKRNKNNT